MPRGDLSPSRWHRVASRVGHWPMWIFLGSLLVGITTVAANTTTVLEYVGIRPERSTSQGAPPLSPPSGDDQKAPVGPGCFDAVGKGLPCSDPDAWLSLQLVQCSESDALGALGVEADATSVSLEVQAVGDQCLARPSRVAVTLGATAADLLKVKDDPAPLATCYQDQQASQETVCSRAHRIEPVEGWKAIENSVRDEDACRDRVERYVGDTIAARKGELSAVPLEAGTQYRCAVLSQTTLYGSVKQLNGRPLPSTPR